jgi:hypothetical protein
MQPFTETEDRPEVGRVLVSRFFAKIVSNLPGSRGRARLERELEAAREQIAHQQKQIRRLRGRHPERSIKPENIVWIFGAGRTGSTWLAAMMGEMSGHAVWFEPQLGLLFDPDRTEVGRRGGTDFVFASRHKDTWLESIRSFVLDGAGARFPELTGEDYLLVKEPHGSAGAPLLLEALPESRAVLLIRDPRDVVASALDAVQKGAWNRDHRQGMYGGDEAVAARERPDAFVEKAAREYLRHVGNAWRAHERHQGYKAVVRYEELRVDTLGTLVRLYSDLELPVDREELVWVVEKHAWENIPEEEKGEGKMRRKATPGKWREDLTSEQIEVVESIVASLLKKFYPERVG